jgi:hypothetical protein
VKFDKIPERVQTKLKSCQITATIKTDEQETVAENTAVGVARIK